MHFLDRLTTAPSRAIAIGAILEVRLKDWLQYEFGGCLNYPIPYGWHSPIELHFSPMELWDGRRSLTHSIGCADKLLQF
ncbi:MAG: hypothetical protein NVS3B5_03950 [Sphingomicrobium sp.]